MPSLPMTARFGWLPIFLLILAAVVALYRSPYSASDLEISPDSVEYAIGAVRLWTKGQYSIVIEGKAYPPRYPLLPSALLVPAYALFGPEPGNGILPVTLMAVAGIGLAWAMGRQVGGPWGGAAAGLALLAFPAYANWSRKIMTDVPSCVLMLAVCLLYQRARGAGELKLRTCLAAGGLAALATALRPVCAAAVLPFLIPIFSMRKGEGIALRLVALFLPVTVPGAINLIYNAQVFGHPMRSGYHFWSPIPYDFFSLTFSPRYVSINLRAIWHCGLAALLPGAGCLLMAVRRWPDAFHTENPRHRRALVEFLVLGAGPMVLFHLFYFFAQDRFYLPAVAVAVILAAGLMGGLLQRFRPGLISVLMGLYLIAVLALRVFYPDAPPLRRLAAERIRQHATEEALVISAIDPVYLEHYANPDAARRIIPFSRRVEYASKRIAPKRLSDPALVEREARQAVQFVASEQIGQLKIDLRRGKRIFLETLQLGPPDVSLIKEFEHAFKLRPAADWLFELEQRE